MKKAIKKYTFGVYDVICPECMAIYQLKPKSILERKKGNQVSFYCEECNNLVQTLKKNNDEN